MLTYRAGVLPKLLRALEEGALGGEPPTVPGREPPAPGGAVPPPRAPRPPLAGEGPPAVYGGRLPRRLRLLRQLYLATPQIARPRALPSHTCVAHQSLVQHIKRFFSQRSGRQERRPALDQSAALKGSLSKGKSVTCSYCVANMPLLAMLMTMPSKTIAASELFNEAHLQQNSTLASNNSHTNAAPCSLLRTCYCGPLIQAS